MFEYIWDFWDYYLNILRLVSESKSEKLTVENMLVIISFSNQNFQTLMTLEILKVHGKLKIA